MVHSKIRLIVLLLLGTQMAHSQVWTPQTAFPGMNRDDGVGFYLPSTGCGFVGTGMDAGFQPTNDFWKFNISTNSWTQIANLPALPRQYATSFVCSSSGPEIHNGYIFGGVSSGNQCLRDLWSYNHITNTWSQKSDLPSFSRMGSDAIEGGTVANIVFGRDSMMNPTNENWCYYAILDSWIQKTSCPISRWNGVAYYQNSARGIAGLGQDSSGNALSDLWEYDGFTDTWSFYGNFPGGKRYGASSGTLTVGSFLNWFICFGRDSANNTLSDIWIDQGAGNWFQYTSLPASGRKGTSFFGNGCANWFVCGIDQNNTRLNENWMLSCPLSINEEQGTRYAVRREADGNYKILFEREFSGKVQLYSASGKREYEKECKEAREIPIRLADLPKGIYLLGLGEGPSLKLINY